MSIETRARLLNRITDLSAQKVMVMHWWAQGAITGDEAEQLIRGRGLAAA